MKASTVISPVLKLIPENKEWPAEWKGRPEPENGGVPGAQAREAACRNHTLRGVMRQVLRQILSRTASAPLVHSCPTLLAPFFDSSCTLLRPSFDNSSTLLVLALAQFHPASKSRELRTSDTSYYINSKGEELHITDHPNVNNHALTALRRK